MLHKCIAPEVDIFNNKHDRMVLDNSIRKVINQETQKFAKFADSKQMFEISSLKCHSTGLFHTILVYMIMSTIQ